MKELIKEMFYATTVPNGYILIGMIVCFIIWIFIWIIN